jgi:hypothetical protein
MSAGEWPGERRVPGTMSNPQEDRPVDFSAVPDEEGIDEADAAGRLDDDPEAQPNLTEDDLKSDLDPDDA